MLEKDISEKISEILVIAIRKYFQENLPDTPFPEETDVFLQAAKDKQHGDMTSNIAMQLAKSAGVSPVKLSEGISARLQEEITKDELSSYVGKIEAKSGFINIWFSEKYHKKVLMIIKKEKGDFGRSRHGRGKHINLEFVSANPTGPLTIAHGRQAAIGDALSRILAFNGYRVTNEYYLNDLGRQVDLLGRSVEVRYRGLFGREEHMPEGGYMGGYIVDIAKEIKTEKGDGLLEKGSYAGEFFRKYAVDYMVKLIKKDLADFGVHFDVWTSQAELEGRREVEKVLDRLKKRGHTYEDGGARWFASTRFEDDKDRVVVKSDGSYTYLAPDIAYHDDKYRRGHDRLIDLLGPDHHGYVRRMKAAVQALGHEARSLDMLLVQLVTLLRGGEAVSMSTREGKFVSLREVMDEIGADVARFFFFMRRLDSHLDFDIGLAKEESADNPVFYIQYAHARICSIKKYSTMKFGRKQALRLAFQRARLDLLKHDAEKALVRQLGDFPLVARISADTLEPSKLLTYLNELARGFHAFYTECRVVSDDIALTKARLFLVECVRIVLANGLGLLNITLPERM